MRCPAVAAHELARVTGDNVANVANLAKAARRPFGTILGKLLLAFAVPTTVLFAGFAVFAHQLARRDLDQELGERLAAVAAAAATQIRGKYLVDLGPGDEQSRATLNVHRKLEAVRHATGIDRLFVFDSSFQSRVDTRPGITIGTTYFRAKLDRHELARVFENGDAVASVLFSGPSGTLYKTGYAPIYADDDSQEIVLAIGATAPAELYDQLSALRQRLIIAGAIIAGFVLIISVVMATLITRPVRHLAAAAARIGKGDLDSAVTRTSGDEIGFLATTMEEMRRDLRDRDQRMQMMLSGIAHEIRNPLGGMELYAGILRDELAGDDERQGHVARIEKQLTHLEAVVSEFLDYARRPRPELLPVSLADIAIDVAELCAQDATAAGIELEVESGDRARCLGDDSQLRRVVLNLVKNAIQAAEADSRVRITAQTRDDRAKLAVTNQGADVPDDIQERMFEPFFTTREKGTGLGLAFVREIVRDHGGNITVTSAAGTTTFTIDLSTPS